MTEDFLYDFVVQFLESPLWTTPINNFIDTHCAQFEDVDENKLIYTDIHNKFSALVERLLETSLRSLGVSDAQFLSAVKRGKKMKQLVFGHILAADDFIIFKKVMVRRNHELGIQALRNVKKNAGMHGPLDSSRVRNPTESTENSQTSQRELQIEDDRRLAERLLKQERALVGELIGEADDADDDMRTVLEACMIDSAIESAELRKQAAELEEAIALSILVEEQRQNAAATTSSRSVSQAELARQHALPTPKVGPSSLLPGKQDGLKSETGDSTLVVASALTQGSSTTSNQKDEPKSIHISSADSASAPHQDSDLANNSNANPDVATTSVSVMPIPRISKLPLLPAHTTAPVAATGISNPAPLAEPLARPGTTVVLPKSKYEFPAIGRVSSKTNSLDWSFDKNATSQLSVSSRSDSLRKHAGAHEASTTLAATEGDLQSATKSLPAGQRAELLAARAEARSSENGQRNASTEERMSMFLRQQKQLIVKNKQLQRDADLARFESDAETGAIAPSPTVPTSVANQASSAARVEAVSDSDEVKRKRHADALRQKLRADMEATLSKHN